MKNALLFKLYLALSGGIFLLVGVLHLVRSIGRWPVMVAGTPVPMVLSYIGFPVATGCAVWALWLLRRRE